MMPGIRDRLKTIIDNGQRALIAFMMAAFPDEERSLEYIKAAERGGCDILELGVPFSDPLADGEVIERLHHRGVNAGFNLNKGLKFAVRVKRHTSMPIILFSYYNPIYKMGLKRFVQACNTAGIEGVIIPDMPLHEMQILNKARIEAIPMVAPSSTAERLKMAADMNPAFIYCVTVRGVTGVRASFPEDEVRDYLLRVRKITDSPLAMGFGISGPEIIEKFKNYADAFVVGSYLAGLMEQNESNDNITTVGQNIETEISRLKQAAL